MNQKIKLLSQKVVNFADSIHFGLATTSIQRRKLYLSSPKTIHPDEAYYILNSNGKRCHFPLPPSYMMFIRKRISKVIVSSGDKIEFILDLCYGIISCHIYSKNELCKRYVLYRDIKRGQNLEYSLMLQFENKGDSATLMQFEELRGIEYHVKDYIMDDDMRTLYEIGSLTRPLRFIKKQGRRKRSMEQLQARY